MANLFEKRATELFRNENAFLSVVTPEPLLTFLRKPAQEERLYDRLTVIIGTPGSGKTTLARLFQYHTLKALLGGGHDPSTRSIIDALSLCRAVSRARPTLLACRIPLEADYRDFWGLPYPDQFKNGLMIAFLQARTVLGWLRNIKSSGVPLDEVRIVPRDDARAAVTTIGGTTGPELLERAQAVELAIYRISAALLAPRIESIRTEAIGAYRPFDVIESFRIGVEEEQLRPLVILDDAHLLHPNQLKAVQSWLARRELKVARWALTRLDALSPYSVLTGREVLAEAPGLDRSRETTVIWMQGGTGWNRDRPKQRRAFRKMSKAMAERYLSEMDVFHRRGLTKLGVLLSTVPDPIPAAKEEKLRRRVKSLQGKCGVSHHRRLHLERMVDRYLENTDDSGGDLRLAILAILFKRYAIRTPLQSRSHASADDSGANMTSQPLFDHSSEPPHTAVVSRQGLFDVASSDAEPRQVLRVDSGVADGARIHLLHEYERPYYFGIDALCDASSENAEQFLRLTARLVEHMETQLIRREEAVLASRIQHQLLQKRAEEMIDDWEFPESRRVRSLVHSIAKECLAKSLRGNAPFRGGVNAVGIPQADFNEIPERHPKLARVLQFGVAYNAFTLLPHHFAKRRQWCLIELGGIPILRYGLTLKRGGFLERCVGDLEQLLSED